MKNKLQQIIAITGAVRIVKRKAGSEEILSISEWMPNLIVNGANTGRNLIAQRLGSTNTFSLNVTHGEIGTGQTAPANTDIALTTPTVRAAVTNQIIASNVVTCQFFFADATLANGTYYEFGTFIDGTAAIGSGKMFNHVLFGTPYAKNAGEDTTIEVQFTIS